MDKYITQRDEVWEYFSNDLFQGYARSNPPVPKGEPWLSFIGPKITMATWREVIAFFKWTYEDSKGESQVRLYLNKELGTWRAWAFPQERSYGMTTEEIPDREGDERKKAGLGKGWIEGGSVHHHCGGGAFQSGTDRDNEASKNGIHITVGKIDNRFEYEIHGRVVFRGVFYTGVDWPEWFVMPPGLDALPWQFRKPVMEHFLTRAVTDEDTFPSEWKDNVVKKVYPSQHSQLSSWMGGKKHDDPTDPKAGETKTSTGTTKFTQSNNGEKSKKPLTKKERKLLRKLINRASEDDDLESDLRRYYNSHDVMSLNSAALLAVQLAQSSGIEINELFDCLQREPNHLDTVQASAADQLHDILDKENVWPDELLDWIHTITLADEEVPTDGGKT